MKSRAEELGDELAQMFAEGAGVAAASRDDGVSVLTAEDRALGKRATRSRVQEVRMSAWEWVVIVELKAAGAELRQRLDET